MFKKLIPTDAKFWMWNNYVIEEDWDFGFVEVSTDGGTTWVNEKVYNEDGSEASTPDDYPDPNGNLATFGNLKYGLTASSGGWAHQYVDLSAMKCLLQFGANLRYKLDLKKILLAEELAVLQKWHH